ncbi:hypothetical protein IAP91_06600 [Leuconostoc mesenteroides]|nr:hypothetical protein [Leuconostoc mesenteroides]
MTNIPSQTASSYSAIVEANTIYTFTVGRKNKTKRIVIDFTNDEFRHLAGFQYLTDVEFPSRKSENIFFLTRDNTDFQETILASTMYSKIEERITHLAHLDWVLSHPDDIVVWSPTRAKMYSKLKADYLISRKHEGKYDIFGIEKGNKNYHGVTFMVEETDKYINGQTKWFILKIERSTKVTSEILFVSPSFREDELNTDSI